MKRVLMISDVYFPRINGVSTSIATFRAALRELDVEVRLVVPRYGSEAEEDGVVRVQGRPVPRDPEDGLVAWGKMREAALREAEQCDLVHVQTPFLAHYAGRALMHEIRFQVSPVQRDRTRGTEPPGASRSTERRQAVGG